MPRPEVLSRRFAMFLMVGLLNTAVGVAIITAGILLGMQPLAANALGYACGLCVSFIFNSRLTFHGGARNVAVFARYIVAFLVAYACNLLTVLVLQHLFPGHVLLTTTLGIVPYTIVFFVLAQYFVFNDDAGTGTGGDSADAR